MAPWPSFAATAVSGYVHAAPLLAYPLRYTLTQSPLPLQIVFVIRLSIIPSHMSTAVFSTCDVKFWHFAVSTFFTLPKQLILVYLGVLLVGGQSDFWIKFGLFGVAGGVTVIAGVWIWYKMRSIKKELLARQERLKADKESRLMTSAATGALRPRPGPEETIPLGRNNSYGNLPQDDYTQGQTGPAYGYGYNQAGATGADPRANSVKPEFNAYSPPAPAGGYGYAQTTPYPEDNGGDLGAYGQTAQFPVPYDSPEQKKAVHPHGFV